MLNQQCRTLQCFDLCAQCGQQCPRLTVALSQGRRLFRKPPEVSTDQGSWIGSSILRSIAAFALCFVANVTLCTAQSYDEGFEPTPPAPFPAAYNEYQILPGSVSPSGQYALIYPRRSVLFEIKEAKLLLVGLAPFRALSELPVKGALAASAHGSYSVSWAKNGAAMLFVAGRKWGPGEVFLVAFRNGQPEPSIDLVDNIRQLLEPEFKKSKAPPFNYSEDFVLENSASEVANGVTVGRGWIFDQAGHVLIDCTCTSDPKGDDSRAWTIKFRGTWDISKGQLISYEMLSKDKLNSE
jgi:hypothetical protein